MCNMQRITLFIFLLIAASACRAENNTARVHGVLKEATTLKFDGSSSAISDLGSVMLEPDQNGHFDVIIPLDKPTWFTLSRNPIYLSPGDDLEVVYIDDYPEKSAFKGKGAEANNFLRERFFSKGGSYLSAGSHAYPEFDKTKMHIDSVAASRLSELERLSGVTEEFKELERIRVKADIINSLMMYLSYVESNKHRIQRDYVPHTKEEWDKMEKDFNLKVKHIVQPLLDDISGDERYLEIEVVRTALTRVARMEEFTVKPSDRYDELGKVAANAKRINNKTDENAYKELLAFGEQIKYPDYKAAYMAKLNRNVGLAEGQPAIDTEMMDLDGNKKMLSEFKGKVMYVDVWATWCGPCMAESPFFKELSERFPQIRFVAVSVDSEKAWKNYMKNKEHGKIIELLAIDQTFRTKWDIGGIPRFMLIDENFNIITPNAPRPSDSERIIPLLEKYVK